MRTYKKSSSRKRTRKIREGLNVLGKPLKPCNKNKVTGYYRDGFCSTGNEDTGTHVVCAIMDDNFLQYTLSQDNDLITPSGNFPGLVAGDRWCVCALRWMQAYRAGKAPRVVLSSTDMRALKFIPRKILIKNAYQI
jgi:uncharacterized protein (DUF2237 family)